MSSHSSIRIFAWLFMTAVIAQGIVGQETGVSQPTTAQQLALLSPDQTENELRAYLHNLVIPFVTPTNAKKWTSEGQRIRQRVLKEVVFRGVPESWRAEPTHVIWGETIQAKGYVIRKLRYEVVPGLWVGGLLYEPMKLSGKVPAVLNVNGHVREPGMTQDYEQARSINLAKRGILSLHPEWIGMGQLMSDGYNHHEAEYLELCGIAGVSVHYLELKRGLDILLAHPATDPQRVAVTGLSGGGWQTIFISSLDTRVKLSAPVAGYVGNESRVMNPPDMGDDEQSPTDLGVITDYVHMTAMMAPRPTLLINNVRDACCFRADRARTSMYEPVIPVYALYNKPECFAFHINEEPGDHNYALDNRQAFYRFLNRHFLPERERKDDEIPVDDEIRKQEELSIQYPPDNGTFFSLAAEAMRSLPAHKYPGDDSKAAGDWRNKTRIELAKVLRFKPFPSEMDYANKVSVTIPAMTGAKSQAWLLRIGLAWTIPVMEYVPEGADVPWTTLILADGGRDKVTDIVEQTIHSRHRAIVADLLLTGECTPATPASYLWSLLISMLGQRSLGIQVEQLQAIIQWIERNHPDGHITIVTQGRMSGLAALVFAALHPEQVKNIQLQGMDASLKDLLAQKVDPRTVSSVFCPDLLKVADVSDLIVLAQPTQIDAPRK